MVLCVFPQVLRCGSNAARASGCYDHQYQQTSAGSAAHRTPGDSKNRLHYKPQDVHNWSRPLRVSELNVDSPYNLRKHTGLPPTPIGSPGLASIQAAAHPAHVPYLYYVVKPGGHGAHAFSSTDAQFQRDVRRYNQARAQNGGRSPAG